MAGITVTGDLPADGVIEQTVPIDTTAGTSGEIDDAFREKLLSCYDPAQDEAAQQVEPEEEEADDEEQTGEAAS